MKNFFTRNGIKLAGFGLATAAAGLILGATNKLSSDDEVELVDECNESEETEEEAE